MNHRLGAVLGVLALACLPPTTRSADTTPNRWHTVQLWQDEILSARLRYLTPASLADETAFVFEFENHTPTPLVVGQAFLNLDGDRQDPDSGEVKISGGVSSGAIFHGRLAPGITPVSNDICFAASENLGDPPPRGFRVVLHLRCEARLDDGRTFTTPGPGIRFTLQWLRPDAAGIVSAAQRLRRLLDTPRRSREENSRLMAILRIPEVVDSLTVEEVLRNGLLPPIANRLPPARIRRFTTDPRVVARYSDRIEQGDTGVLAEFGSTALWNPAWIPPLVADFEKRGNPHTLNVLSWHRDEWIREPRWPKALSAALLRHRPLLARDIPSLKPHELLEWCSNAREAAVTGDPALAPIFLPGLSDRRLARHPKEHLLASGPFRDRICDASLITVLTLLDGTPLPAMREAGAVDNSWPADVEKRAPLFDRAIAQLQERLRQSAVSPITPAPGSSRIPVHAPPP